MAHHQVHPRLHAIAQERHVVSRGEPSACSEVLPTCMPVASKAKDCSQACDTWLAVNCLCCIQASLKACDVSCRWLSIMAGLYLQAMHANGAHNADVKWTFLRVSSSCLLYVMCMPSALIACSLECKIASSCDRTFMCTCAHNDALVPLLQKAW